MKGWMCGKVKRSAGFRGTYPVISLSFANIKENNYDLARRKLCQILSDLYSEYNFLLNENILDEYGLSDRKQEVKDWYDGFTFGTRTDIYNPWSILNYLDKKQLGTYWANSSSNSLAGKLIREGSRDLKASFERLLQGESIITEIDEQIVYDQLDDDEQAVWSLLLASGYLRVKQFKAYMSDYGEWKQEYELLLGDIRAMNAYMNKVALTTFSYFDTGNRPSGAEPERFHGVEATTKGLKEPNPSVCFYHGFVLGLMMELADRYILTSNRESGFGRYDVMLEPRRPGDNGIILEFKVQNPDDEKELSDTVNAALEQVRQKQYETILIEKGIPGENIRKYGFAFCGRQVLIGGV